MVRTIIAGAGAAGLMAAISAAEEGSLVTVLEHKDRAGKKLSMTGNGRCNLTNMNQKKEFYHSENSEFPYYVLEKLNLSETLKFFESLGLKTKEKNGYVYPYSDCAEDVTGLLINRCNSLGVKFIFKCEVKKIIKRKKDFLVEYISEGERKNITGDSVIIAAGSKAAPKTGSDGSGYYFAKSLGHNIIEPLPSLTGLKVKEALIKEAAGVRAYGGIKVYREETSTNVLISEDKGEIQFTPYGVSGIPAFQVSGAVGRNIYNGCRVKGTIDLFPDMTKEEVTDFLEDKVCKCPYKTAAEQLMGAINGRLAKIVLELAKISADETLSKSDHIIKLAEYLKGIPFTVTGTNDFDNAQVCTGGVDTREIDEKTLQSKLVKGVFFAGEVLDVDGICGGYNLQWAWSSGYVAGKSAAGK